MEVEGEITVSNTVKCHNITIVDDDFIEPPEDLKATLHPVFNAANVDLSPDITTVTIVDADGKNIGVCTYIVGILTLALYSAK